MKIHYAVYENGYRHELPGQADYDAEYHTGGGLEFVAEEAAADYHSNHDGWESQWPQTIRLYDGKTGPEIGRFTVEREYEPSFSANKVADPVGAHERKAP